MDPTLLDPAAPQHLARAPSARGPLPRPLDEAEKEKAAHYADTPPPFSFYPFAVGTQTELGASASAFLHTLWRNTLPGGATAGRIREPCCSLP